MPTCKLRKGKWITPMPQDRKDEVAFKKLSFKNDVTIPLILKSTVTFSEVY